MGKHGNKENGRVEKPDDGYQPKHAAGQDGFEWAAQRPKEQEKKDEKK